MKVSAAGSGSQSDVKSAIVTLEEGHRIDVTTGSVRRSVAMALKTYKPVTPSQRQLVIVDRSELYKGKPVKSLTEGKNSTGGRNNHGPHHRRASAAAVTSRPIASSTSSAASSMCRRRSSGWNTIRTAPPSSR